MIIHISVTEILVEALLNKEMLSYILPEIVLIHHISIDRQYDDRWILTSKCGKLCRSEIVVHSPAIVANVGSECDTNSASPGEGRKRGHRRVWKWLWSWWIWWKWPWRPWIGFRIHLWVDRENGTILEPIGSRILGANIHIISILLH
jgi:hypothetical protein